MAIRLSWLMIRSSSKTASSSVRSAARRGGLPLSKIQLARVFRCAAGKVGKVYAKCEIARSLVSSVDVHEICSMRDGERRMPISSSISSSDKRFGGGQPVSSSSPTPPSPGDDKSIPVRQGASREDGQKIRGC